MPGAQQSARLTQSQEEQLQNAQRLAELSRQGENTVREAMKNSLIPEETIRQWGQTVQQWQDLSAEKMQEAARAMETAAQDAKSRPAQPNSPSQEQASQSPQSQNSQSPQSQNSQSPQSQNSQSPQSQNPQTPQSQNSQSPQSQNSQSSQNSQTPSPDAKAQEDAAKKLEQEMTEAQKRAEEVLEALRKMEQKANENLDQLQALTLAERLRKVGDEEKGLGSELTTNLADSIGLPPQELPEKFKLLNTSFVKQQDGAHDESAALQAEISRFFERTQMPNYGKVSQEMKDSGVSDELTRMGMLIESNITFQTSVDLTNWSGRFHQWADILQPKSDSSGGQPPSGDSQGKPPLDLTKQLIALLRLREKESTLRAQTDVLEWSKETSADYDEQAGTLAATQDNLGEALALVHEATPVPELSPPFDQVAASMKEAGGLLAKPDTGPVTDGTEARSVDELSDLINLINEKAQRDQQQQQQGQAEQAGGVSAEEMAFLTGMMRASSQSGQPGMEPPGQNPSGRGNLSGGTTDREGNPVTGGAGGRGAAGRNVNRAAGVIQNSPVEFREALENYFHNIEKPGN
jgi:hypothetical protein